MKALYAQVCKDILARIQNGDLRVGDRLPPEDDYAAELGVSRSTLRAAYSELQSLGVLKRRKRAGTVIISDTPRHRFNMATRDINELLRVGSETAFEVTGTRTVRTQDIPQLDGAFSETGYWLEVQANRKLTGEARPFSANFVYVPARYAAIEPLLHATKTSVFHVIEETFGISVGRVTQTLSAIACPKIEAEIIGLSEGAPAMRIDAELSQSDGTIMEVSVATFDPDRFNVHTDVEIE